MAAWIDRHTLRVCGVALVGVGLHTAGFAQEGDAGSDAQTWAEVQAAGLVALESAPTHPSESLTVVAGTVYTGVGAVYSPGAVSFKDGRITYVGDVDGAPTGGQRLEAPDGVLTPGIIDTHSHLGVYPSPGAQAHEDGNEMTRPVTAGVFAEHGVWVQDPGFQRAVAGGITTLQILPGSANLVGGRGVVMRPIPARGARAMRFPGAPETVKLACGENPKRVYGDRGGPGTRMGNVAGQRQAFADAKAYLAAWQAHDAAVTAYREAMDGSARDRRKAVAPGDPPSRNLDMDTLAGVIAGEVLPQIHCYRSDDMLNMLQIADEFGFNIRSFHHAVEAYKIRDILAEREVSVSTWSDWWGFKLEAFDAVLENAALVHAAGGRAIIHSDSAIGIQRLNQESAKALFDGQAIGLDVQPDDAIRWITSNAAWALGIQEQTGSLTPGLRADVVLWDGDPLSVYTAAQRVWIDGVRWHDATDPQQPRPVWSDHSVDEAAVPRVQPMSTTAGATP